jgi:hypothetical protein
MERNVKLEAQGAILRSGLRCPCRSPSHSAQAESGPGGGWLFWTYRSQGISFAFDDNSQVTLVDVFPAEK